jgi:hypothetical protein
MDQELKIIHFFSDEEIQKSQKRGIVNLLNVFVEDRVHYIYYNIPEKLYYINDRNTKIYDIFYDWNDPLSKYQKIIQIRDNPTITQREKWIFVRDILFTSL